MKIWQLGFDVNSFDNLIPVKGFTADEIQSFDGRTKKNNWNPLHVKRMEPEKGLALGDAPGFTIPVFSKKALDVLLPIISDSVEILDLVCEHAEYYGINVISILNVIDYSKSKYRMFSDGKRIMAFQKYAFRLETDIGNYNIFKIVDEPARRAFVSDRFKKLIEDNDLTGFMLKLVWNSEEET